MMASMISLKPSFALHQRRHGCKRMVIKAMKDGRESLNFTLSGGFPGPDPVSDSKNLDTVFNSTASFPCSTLLYKSPTISIACNADLDECFHVVQRDRATPNTDYLSLSRNIPTEVVPPLDSEGLIDFESLVNRVQDGKYGAIYLDPVLGLGDMPGFKPDQIQAMRAACYLSKTLLVVDETISGLGRSGQLWGHQSFKIEPDVMLVDFGVEIGVGAALVNSSISALDSYFLRRHNQIIPPKCMVAAGVVMKVSTPNYEAKVSMIGDYLKEALLKAVGSHPQVVAIRGLGLIMVLQLKVNSMAVAQACRAQGLLVDYYENFIRLTPPAEATEAQIDLAVTMIQKAMRVSYFQ